MKRSGFGGRRKRPLSLTLIVSDDGTLIVSDDGTLIVSDDGTLIVSDNGRPLPDDRVRGWFLCMVRLVPSGAGPEYRV